MELLPSWNDRLAKVPPFKAKDRTSYLLPQAVAYYVRGVTFVDTDQGARDMAEFLQQRPLSHIGFDTEFRYNRPGVVIDKKHTVYDPRSIHPLLLSLSAAEPERAGGALYNFVI